MSKRLCCLLLGLTLLATEATAQAIPATWSDAVRPGVRLLVTTTDGRRTTGRVRTGTADAITLDTPAGVQVLPYDRIARIVVKDSVTDGMLIGLGIGAGAGLAGGLLVNAICVNESGACFGAVFFLTGLGGAIGAGIGSGADGLRHRTVFDRIPDLPNEFVPEVAGTVGFGRSTTAGVPATGPASAGISWSIQNTAGRWGLELQADRSLGSSTRPFICPEPAVAGCGQAQEGVQDLTTATAKGLYYFSSSRIQPYVSGGVVIFQASVWRSDVRQPFFGGSEPIVVEALRRQRGIGFVAGGGARLQLAPHLSVRPDLTYSHADNWKQLRGSIGLGFSW